MQTQVDPVIHYTLNRNCVSAVFRNPFSIFVGEHRPTILRDHPSRLLRATTLQRLAKFPQASQDKVLNIKTILFVRLGARPVRWTAAQVRRLKDKIPGST